MLTNGPVALAICVWQCSFVFHDYDKQTSVYIHFLPALLYYCWRWHSPTLDAAVRASELSLGDYAAATGVYMVWQVLYYVWTEVVCREVRPMV